MKMKLAMVLFGVFIVCNISASAADTSGVYVLRHQDNKMSEQPMKQKRWTSYVQQARNLWQELQSLRYKDNFHKLGYASAGAGGKWIRKEKKLRKSWGKFAKTLTDRERFTCDIVYITTQMYMVGYDWFENDGKSEAATERKIDEINSDLKTCPGGA